MVQNLKPRVQTLNTVTVKPSQTWRDGKTAHERGYDHQWRKARLVFLAANPLCKMCSDNNVVNVATVVDHIIPHRGDQSLFWDKTNWQPLCQHHHNSEAQRKDKEYG